VARKQEIRVYAKDLDLAIGGTDFVASVSGFN
jgi:hypothetical protein